jgi:hypothetical protein
MANVTQQDVTLLDHWTEGDVTGKRLSVLKVQVDVDGAGAGSAGAKIPASAFGLRKIEEVTNAVATDNSAVFVAVPNADGSEILIRNEDDDTPASITEEIQLLVKGETLGVN